jgi:hypothetical protein
MGNGEGYLRLGVLDEKRTYPNTDIEWPKWDFGPTSVIPSHICVITCHSCVGALAYVRWNRSSKVKFLLVPKRTRANTSYKRRSF